MTQRAVGEVSRLAVRRRRRKERAGEIVVTTAEADQGVGAAIGEHVYPVMDAMDQQGEVDALRRGVLVGWYLCDGTNRSIRV